MKDKISIIVPIYNMEKYLNKCVNSIINQSYENLEIILVNDGSTDDSLNICNKFKKKDKRVVFLKKENGGLSSARNYGIEHANGKYISFVDADDYIEKDYREKLYNCITKYKVKISIGGLKTIYENGQKTDYSTKKIYKINKKDAFKKMLYVDEIGVSAWSKLYLKELFDNVKYPEGRIFEDTATTYRLIDQCEDIGVCDYPIYNYCIRSKSITSEKFNIKKMDWIISAIEMTHYLKNKYNDLDNACLSYMMYTHIGVLSSLAMNDKEYKKERKELISYIKSKKSKYLKDENVSKKYKMVTRLICTDYRLFKIALKLFQKINGKRYE